MSTKFDYSKIAQARAAITKRANEIKQAFVQMPGGQKEAQEAPMDPAAAGGMPPPGMDPAMMGGAPMDPAMAGGAPADPAMAGGMPPMDPAMMAAMGGAPMGVDPATAGMLPVDAGAGGAAAGAAGGGVTEPTITLSLSQLWDVVTKVLGLAKKIGANGQGVAAESTPAQPAAGQDAIKAAVIEALGDMGLTR